MQSSLIVELQKCSIFPSINPLWIRTQPILTQNCVQNAPINQSMNPSMMEANQGYASTRHCYHRYSLINLKKLLFCSYNLICIYIHAIRRHFCPNQLAFVNYCISFFMANLQRATYCRVVPCSRAQWWQPAFKPIIYRLLAC